MADDHARIRALLKTLSGLPTEQGRLVVARLQETDPALAQQMLDLARAVKAADAGPGAPRPVPARGDRVQHIARTLNNMNASGMGAVLAGLGASDPALAEAIRRAMFTFDDLEHVDERGMQRLVAEVDQATWRLALRAAPPVVEARIYAQMSTRAAERLREDIEDAGPARRGDVEEAQKLVAAVARRLEKSGQLVVRRPGEEGEWV
jgi:flagellar motor switch protein FliG